jgi:hypothetical protein
MIFILSWCRTHTKIRSTLVFIVTTGSQKITLWGPGGTPLGILRVKVFIVTKFNNIFTCWLTHQVVQANQCYRDRPHFGHQGSVFRTQRTCQTANIVLSFHSFINLFTHLFHWHVVHLRTTSLDTTRPSTIFCRLLLSWATLRRH